MRITGLRVDGYGTLADFEIADLPRGLTVVSGANEAGKSTLLDFIRGVLFGFPDRRFRLPYHAPLRGGRHGGSVRLADSSGQHWVLERHVDSREPLLFAEDGTPAGASTLARLLGGADDALFRNVFAFGLGELSSFESLDRDEIRDVVFSAGVLGAGRSASNAVKLFEQQRTQLVRRRGGAVANVLRGRLDECDAALRSARRSAESYPGLLADHDRLGGNLHTARDEAEALRRRIGEIDRLLTLWPVFRARTGAAESLVALGEYDANELGAIGEEESIRWLGESRSGHLERLAKQAEHRTTTESAESELAVLRTRLGEVPLEPVPLALRDRVEQLSRAVPDAMLEARGAEEAVRRAGQQLAEASTAIEEAGTPEGVRTPQETEEALANGTRLQGALGRLERLSERHVAQVTEADLKRRLLEQSRGGADQTGVWLLVAIAIVAAVVGVAGLVLAARHGLSLALLGALGLVAALLALATAVRLRRQLTSTQSEAAVLQDPELDLTSEEVARLRSSLGRGAIGGEELAELLGSLRAELAERTNLDALTRAQQRAERELTTCEERRRHAVAAIAQIDAAAGELAASLGFTAPVSLDGLRDAIAGLDQANELRQRIARVERAANALATPIEEFEATLARVERALHVERDDDVTRRVRLLESLLARARQQRSERSELEGTVARADTQLTEGLGLGVDASRLAEELRGGAVTDWSTERERLSERLRDAEQLVEEQLGRVRDATRDLATLRASSDVATLEIERASLTEELESTLERWLVYGAAKSLLESCLARYERERQPKVLAAASRLVTEVTEGRYVQLLAHEDDDGKRRGITALSSRGERIDAADLSRGTAEQLYLCLRLAFAMTFAEQSTALPIVADDVLVNFDPRRAAAVARIFAKVAEEHQVLAFTCHPHVVELFAAASPGVRIVEMEEHRSVAVGL